MSSDRAQYLPVDIQRIIARYAAKIGNPHSLQFVSKTFMDTIHEIDRTLVVEPVVDFRIQVGKRKSLDKKINAAIAKIPYPGVPRLTINRMPVNKEINYNYTNWPQFKRPTYAGALVKYNLAISHNVLPYHLKIFNSSYWVTVRISSEPFALNYLDDIQILELHYSQLSVSNIQVSLGRFNYLSICANNRITSLTIEDVKHLHLKSCCIPKLDGIETLTLIAPPTPIKMSELNKVKSKVVCHNVKIIFDEPAKDFDFFQYAEFTSQLRPEEMIPTISAGNFANVKVMSFWTNSTVIIDQVLNTQVLFLRAKSVITQPQYLCNIQKLCALVDNKMEINGFLGTDLIISNEDKIYCLPNLRNLFIEDSVDHLSYHYEDLDRYREVRHRGRNRYKPLEVTSCPKIENIYYNDRIYSLKLNGPTRTPKLIADEFESLNFV